MNRIVERFARLRSDGKKGLVVYFTAGDPDLEATRQLAVGFERAGADILELGIPFSDPLADGPVNQLSAQRGLESGTTPAGVLAMVQALRQESQVPIVLYIYYNLIHRWGMEAFVQAAREAGVDGLLVLDLPPEEGAAYETCMRAAELCAIYLVAPTTPEDRMEMIGRHASGFIYYVSREGVTGMQTQVAASIGEMTLRLRQHTQLPIAVGFGISNPDQARTVARSADAVVVGSAVVHRIAEAAGAPNLVPSVAGFVKTLADAVRSV
jgi:tryptophan synthase alpha chain